MRSRVAGNMRQQSSQRSFVDRRSGGIAGRIGGRSPQRRRASALPRRHACLIVVRDSRRGGGSQLVDGGLRRWHVPRKLLERAGSIVVDSAELDESPCCVRRA